MKEVSSLKVVNVTRNRQLADNVIMAVTFAARLKGLLGRRALPPGWCMILQPCRSVHTMFMLFAIDILFLDNNHRVVGMAGRVPPFRFPPAVRESGLVIELPAGTLAGSGTCAGDSIKITV